MLKMSTSASDITDRSMESKIGTSSVVVDLETLPASNPVTTLTAQDLQDSLVEQSLSETILLQNVTFDANLFDGLNLELDGCGVGSGASSAGTSVIHHNNSHQLGTTIDLSSISSDTMTQNSFEQMNLLETLELQIIKEVQQQQQQQQQSASSNAFLTSSSDPLVSSTTTIYTYEKDQDQQLAADSTDFKAATTSFSGVFTKSPMTVAVKTEPTNSQIIKIGSSGSGHHLIPVSEGALHQQQQQSVILHRSDSSTCTTSSIAELRNLTTTSNGSICGDKAIYLTGPISTAALSLANMKVVGQNVVAFISDQQQERPVLSAEKQSAQPQQSSTSVGAAGTSQQQQQTRLIIIEEKKQPTALTLTTTNASTSTSTTTRPSSKNAAATATSAAAKESKGKADNQKNSSTASAATAKTNSNSNSASSVKEAKGASNIASSTGSNSEANQFTDADSNSGNPSSKAFVPCKVCGDKASGYHYGVTSCEGCKGFFRRSIQKQIEYRCLRDGKCLIIRLNRNRCQYCRFKKCLAVGMSRDSVRYGRVPKKSKEKERLEEKANGVTQAEADQSSVVDIDAKDLALYDTILTISQAHHANCSYTDDKIKGLAKKPIFIMTSHVKLESSDECSSSPDVGSVSESMETQKIELWEQLALLITPCIQRVVEFAKRIPGFSDLTQDDQLILIKLGFFEVWLVHISKTADFVENTLTFADGSFLNRKQLELMFDHEFVGNLFHLMSGLNNLALNDTEIGLFAAIILLQSDRPQIYDIKAINKIQENVMEALKTQITRNHSNDTATFQKLMQKINELRALGSSHSLHLQWFRSNWLRLHLPPLFAEIWDIPLPKSTTFASATPVANISAVSQSSISPRDQQQQQQTNSSPQLNNASMASPIEN